MAAHYLGYVKKSNDRISDGNIIKHILPTIKADMKNEFGSDKTVQNSASEKTLSDASSHWWWTGTSRDA